MKIEEPPEWKFRLKAQKVIEEAKRLFPSAKDYCVTSSIDDIFVSGGHIDVCLWVRDKWQDPNKVGFLYLFATVEKHTNRPLWGKKTVYYDAWMSVDDETAFEPAKKLAAFTEELFKKKFEIVVEKDWL